MRDSLSDWLIYIESIHSAEIEFGLDRVNSVFQRLFPDGIKSQVITVGGTNGKGSTCAYMESILLTAGFQCGKYTSPHLLEFNERISVNGKYSEDDTIVEAFAAVEKYREEIDLTYFEFTFLAALWVFENEQLDFIICEVGLGGRLDAVNILSPIVSVITSIGMDHTQWLGDTLEAIALEKVAIARPGKPCVIACQALPAKAVDYLQQHKAQQIYFGQDYQLIKNDNGQYELSGLLIGEQRMILPDLAARHLYENAACAVVALLALQSQSQQDCYITNEHISVGIKETQLMGRCQIIDQHPLTVIDVSHNEDSARALAEFIISQNVKGKIVAVFSILNDKDINQCLVPFKDIVDSWFIAPLDTQRARTVMDISRAINKTKPDIEIKLFEKISEAFIDAKNNVMQDDCILVFGSFYVVSDILRLNELN